MNTNDPIWTYFHDLILCLWVWAHPAAIRLGELRSDQKAAVEKEDGWGRVRSNAVLDRTSTRLEGRAEETIFVSQVQRCVVVGSG